MTTVAPRPVMWTPDPMRQRLADYTVELEKPAVYAAAGIPHFWRIEMDPVHVYAYDLVDGAYEAAGDSDEVLRLSEPFDIELQIGDITP